MGSKKVSIFLSLFGVVGLALLGVSGWLLFNTFSFLNDPEVREAKGTVVELIKVDTSTSKNPNSFAYTPKVSFTKADGTQDFYQSGTSANPPAYTVGEEVVVLYKGIEYKLRSFGDLYFGATITGIIGLVFAGVGFGITAFGIRRRKIIERLKINGTPVKAKITEIIYNTSLKVNGRSPWKITAQSTDSALGISVFTSDNIWFDPTEFAPIGKEVTVMVNMAKPKEYWMDTSFLPTQR